LTKARTSRATFAAAALLAAALRAAAAQAPSVPPDSPSSPSFPAQVSAITVDAVVLDRSGAPIRGLTRDDFTVLEDGRPQTIIGFEARESAGAPLSADAPERLVRAPTRGTNVGAPESGRNLVILIDDLGLTPPTTSQLREPLVRWLTQRALAAPDDEITLMTTSGELWWSDSAGAGGADLLAVLERLRGKRESRSRSDLAVTDEEAAIIEYGSDTGVGGDSQGGSPGAGAGPGTVGPPLVASSASVLDRVARRLLDQSLCFVCTNCGDPMASCKSNARASAHLANQATRNRLDGLLGTLERISRSLGPRPGRKSILVLGENFPRDETMESRYRALIDVAQRGNVSVYFSGARGITGGSGYSADSRTAPAPGDISLMNVEENLIAFAGAAQIVETTGGTLTHSNDLTAGLERMAADQSAYYLLGYQPEASAAGKWHKLEVRVGRPGATVRARRGYRAGPPPPEPRRDRRNAAADLPRLVTASLAGGTPVTLPLRMAATLQGPDRTGGANVQVVVEVDGSRLQFEISPSGSNASLELTILAIARDRPFVLPRQETLDMRIAAGEKPDWYAFFRQIRLAPGVTQVRATMRDRKGGLIGSASARLDVPDLDHPYLSTPFLTDRTQPPLAAGEPPRLVPTAQRVFAQGRPLHCQYEVFNFGGHDMPGVPRVTGGYTLRAADGRVVEVAAPTLIGTDGTRVVRRITIPTSRLDPGAYELLIDVEDRLAQRNFTAREAFVVAASGAAAAERAP
jgi:VWFA-related protein